MISEQDDDDDDNLEGFEDALDGGNYESWVFADDLVDNAAEWSEDESGRGGGGAGIGSSSSSSSLNRTSKDQQAAGGGGVDYASQYVSVFPVKSGSERTRGARGEFSSTDDDDDEGEEGDGFDERDSDVESRSSSRSSNSSASLRYLDEQPAGRGRISTGSRSWNEDQEREPQESQSVVKDRSRRRSGRSLGNGEPAIDGRSSAAGIAVGSSSTGGSSSSSSSRNRLATRPPAAGQEIGRMSPSEALVHSSFQLRNFEPVQIEMHPSRIAVHPSTGKLYHIADYVLLFPNVPYQPYSDISSGSSSGGGGGSGMAASASDPRGGAVAPNIGRGQSTSKVEKLPSSAAAVNEQPTARSQDSRTPKVDDKRHNRGRSFSNAARDAKGNVKTQKSLPSASASTSASASAVTAATAAMRDTESIGADNRVITADSTPSLPSPDDHPDAVRIHTVKRFTKDVHGLRLCQELNTRSGLICCMALSHAAVYLAAAGASGSIYVWKVIDSSAEDTTPPAEQTPSASRKRGQSKDSGVDGANSVSIDPEWKGATRRRSRRESSGTVFHHEPFHVWSGHKKHVIDMRWSNRNLLLTASLDWTARLWHLSRDTCISKILHNDIVTSIDFHPLRSEFCMTGSFDRKLRLWFITQSKVSKMTSTPAQITAVAFHPRGELFVAGLVDGQCLFYNTQSMNYMTAVKCKNRYGNHHGSTRVTGCQFDASGKQLLVTTNDSNIRLINMEDFTIAMKFKGTINKNTGTIRAFFSGGDGRHIICGSQGHNVFIWRTDQNPETLLAALRSSEMYAGEEAGDSSVAASSTRGKRGGSTTAASSHEKAFAREAKQARRALRHRKCASYEYFDAFANYPSDVAVPVAIIAPRRILKFHHPFPLGEAQPSRLIITASSDGTVRVFGTFSPRFPKTLDL